MIVGFDASRINVANRTGTENYSYQLLKNLLQIDQDNSYKLYVRKRIEDQELTGAGIEQQVINMPRLWTQVGLAYQVWAQTPGLLFVPAHTLPVIRPPKLPTVVTIHDLGAEYLPQYHKFPGKLYLNRATEYAIHNATHLIAVSEFTKKDIINKYGVDPSRVTAIPLGVDLNGIARATPQQVEVVKKKYGIHQKYVLFVGTIQPRKNLVRLIEAFASLVPKDHDLVLAGGKGWLSEEIYAAPKRLGIADRVKFLGYIDEEDKPSLYSGATLTALVSLFEGFGLPAIESMACGTPVLASSTSSLPEVVGAAGILVDPTSVQNIADGMKEGIFNLNRRQKLIVEGHAQAAKFDWKDTAIKTKAVFDQLRVTHG